MPWRLGYKHVCQFFAHDLFQDCTLWSFDWYMRLDSDSMLQSKIDYDSFEFLQKNDQVFGYRCLSEDNPDCVRGVGPGRNVCSAHRHDSRLRSALFTEPGPDSIAGTGTTRWNRKIYYNNLEILKLDFWKSKKYSDIFQGINRSRDLYRFQWGDAPIRTLALNAFSRSSQVHFPEDFTYHHGRTFYKRGR